MHVYGTFRLIKFYRTDSTLCSSLYILGGVDPVDALTAAGCAPALAYEGGSKKEHEAAGSHKKEKEMPDWAFLSGASSAAAKRQFCISFDGVAVRLGLGSRCAVDSTLLYRPC